MAVAAFTAFNTAGFLSRAVQAKAVVIDLYYVNRGEAGSWVPAVRFIDALGVEHTAKGGYDQNYNLPSVGDDLDILCDPGNPEADFWTPSNVWSYTYILLAASVGFTALGLFLIKRIADFESKRKMNQAFVATPKKESFEGDFSTCMGCNSHIVAFSIGVHPAPTQYSCW